MLDNYDAQAMLGLGEPEFMTELEFIKDKNDLRLLYNFAKKLDSDYIHLIKVKLGGEPDEI